MKKPIRYLACIAVILISMAGCSSQSVNSSTSTLERTIAESQSASSDISSEVSSSESSVTDAESGSSKIDAKKVQQNTSRSEFETSESDSSVAYNTEAAKTAGISEIKLLDADSNSTPLSSGTYTVKIGNKTVTLSGAYVVDGTSAVITGGSYSSSESDQNVFLVINGGSLTLKNAEITKTGNASQNDSKRSSDVSDEYNFYGINSVILVVGDGSTANIEDCTITSDCSGANAIFSLKGANIDVNNVSISTTGNSSRGVYATYGGTIMADHLDKKLPARTVLR